MKRLMRVLEYVGDDEWIEMNIKTRHLKESYHCRKGSIYEYINTYPQDVGIPVQYRDLLERVLHVLEGTSGRKELVYEGLMQPPGMDTTAEASAYLEASRISHEIRELLGRGSPESERLRQQEGT